MVMCGPAVTQLVTRAGAARQDVPRSRSHTSLGVLRLHLRLHDELEHGRGIRTGAVQFMAHVPGALAGAQRAGSELCPGCSAPAGTGAE